MSLTMLIGLDNISTYLIFFSLQQSIIFSLIPSITTVNKIKIFSSLLFIFSKISSMSFIFFTKEYFSSFSIDPLGNCNLIDSYILPVILPIESDIAIILIAPSS